MSPGARNVPIDDEFGDRIKKRRTTLGLRRSDVVDRAGLNERTLREIEGGKRRAIQENTLFSLAEALSATVEQLLDRHWLDDPQPTTSRRFGLRAVIVAVLAVVLATGTLGAWTWNTAKQHADWTIDRNGLEVRDSLLGRVLWRMNNERLIGFDSPWSDDHLLIGISSVDAIDKNVYCLDRATGDTIWSVGPDIDAVRRAFGSEIVDAASFSVHAMKVGDIQGDGEADLVVRLTHGLNYPAIIMVVDRHGRRESQYANKGHLLDLEIFDIDGDGRDEILAAGTNNDKAYMGGTLVVLDEHHRHGASVDELANPESPEIDGSLARIIFRTFDRPYMEILEIDRLNVKSIRAVPRSDGGSDIRVAVGHYVVPTYSITLSPDLELGEIVLEDTFSQRYMISWPDSLKVGTGPADKAWRDAWLDRRVVFRARDRVPVSID